MVYSLTTQEKNIVQEVCKGKTNKQIAYALKISPHTVGEHLKNIYIKLEVDNRVSLCIKAMQKGIVPCVQEDKCKK